MIKQLSKRSDIEKQNQADIDKMVADGKAIKEQPRQMVRNLATGRYIASERAPETLPTYLIAMQSNTLIYNDVDVEAFKQEVRHQAARIQEAMSNERFENDGIAYQQFIDQFDACFEMPTMDVLDNVKRRGIDLYAILEHQGNRLAQQLGIENQPDEAVERRFNDVTQAHINLFFYMLILNLALHNKIDNAQRQLRLKLGLLEKRLKHLLYSYIYHDERGRDCPYNSASSTLYGWILLHKNDLKTARAIYKYDPAEKFVDFDSLHAEVMSRYTDTKGYDRDTPRDIRNSAFSRRGLTDGRTQIALKLSLYLYQIAIFRGYLDELTEGSESDEAVDATTDVRSLLRPDKTE